MYAILLAFHFKFVAHYHLLAFLISYVVCSENEGN